MIASKKDIQLLLGKISNSSDQGAFEELFNIYYSWLHAVAISIVRKKEEAEEIVEDVFLKLWEMREGFARIDNLDTYLYTATKNKSYDYYKKNSKAHFVELENENQGTGYIISPEEAMLFEELQSKYKEAVDNLSPKCLQAYKLVREEGYSYTRAGEILGVSPRTIENHLRTAIQKIREALAPYLENSDEQQSGKLYLLFFLF
ncbi:MAG: RNA polymerase sigma-70 factor [Cyclobacteriaceae bacterium]